MNRHGDDIVVQNWYRRSSNPIDRAPELVFHEWIEQLAQAGGALNVDRIESRPRRRRSFRLRADDAIERTETLEVRSWRDLPAINSRDVRFVIRPESMASFESFLATYYELDDEARWCDLVAAAARGNAASPLGGAALIESNPEAHDLPYAESGHDLAWFIVVRRTQGGESA